MVLDDERKRHIKRFEALHPLTIKTLARSARLPYLRVNRYIMGGQVRLTDDERRRLDAAIYRHDLFRRFDDDAAANFA